MIRQRHGHKAVQQTHFDEPGFRGHLPQRPSTRGAETPSPRKARVLYLLLATLLLGSGRSATQEAPSDARSFSFADRARVRLTADWSAHSDALLPPPPLLIDSAPHLVFSEFILLENRTAPAILQLGVSDNPFLGSDASQLDARMHEHMVRDLFYFFFPPPRTCLAGAKTSFEEARRREEERARREEEEQEKDQKKPASARKPVVVSLACEFSATPADLYAAQVSPGIILRQAKQGDRAEGQWRNFYLPPMEQVEIRGETFFLFEARAEQALERGDIEGFGLADERRGARAHFFWAIGANSPFPFLRDPQRKDLQLLHVVYACLSADDNARAEFRKLLESIAFEP